MIALQLIGRLGKDAEVKEVNSKKVLEFTVAVDTGYGENKKTLWVQCSKWGENTAVGQYLIKGKQVHVSGEPSLNTYTNKEGKEVTTLRLRCMEITLVGDKGSGEQVGVATTIHNDSFSNNPPDAIDDLPF